jgi:hypothetical protein
MKRGNDGRIIRKSWGNQNMFVNDREKHGKTLILCPN